MNTKNIYFNVYSSRRAQGYVKPINFKNMCKVKASVNDMVDAISTWQHDFLEREIMIANVEYQEQKENESNHRDVTNPNSK